MRVKIIIQSVLIILIALIQFSFISGLPLGLNNFNLIVIVLIFILGLSSLKRALWWAAGLGLLLDIFSFSPFGVFLLSLSLTVLAAYFLLRIFFTNRSLYSFFALTIFSTIFYGIFLNLINYLMQAVHYRSMIFYANKNFWLSFGEQLFLNLIATIAVFYIINFITNRWKPVFLINPAPLGRGKPHP